MGETLRGRAASRKTALSKTDVVIHFAFFMAHERFFNSLVFATVATALH